MNKYEEALDVIARYISDSKHGITRYSENTTTEKLSHLKELTDKEEKYRWHDLRKDPNDLPSEGVAVLLIFDYCGKHYIVGKYYKESNDKCPWFVDIDDCPYADQVIEEFENIIAWKYIEEFEDEYTKI